MGCTRAALHWQAEASFLTLPISADSTFPLPYSFSVGWPYSACFCSASDVLVRWLPQDRTNSTSAFPAFQWHPALAQNLDIFPPHPDSWQVLTVSCWNQEPIKTSSVLPARLGPLTHHIAKVHLKIPRDLYTDTITGKTKKKQTSGHSRLQNAQVNPNMSAVMYLYFPASPVENKNFMKCWPFIC